jgi:predicted ATP-binding protein involved in virulence
MYYFARNLFDEDLLMERNIVNQMRGRFDYLDIDVLFTIIEKYWDVTSGDMIDERQIPPEILRMGLAETVPMLIPIRKFTKNLSVHLIQAQRLISRPRIKSDKKTDEDISVVKLYSDELAKVIGERLAKSAEKAQKLDSTFPHRVISQTPPLNAKDAYAELRDELQKLREKRIHLKETGILVELGGELEIPEVIDDEDRLNFLNGVLTEYVRDTKEKLVVFDELSDKIELIKRIINERFAPHKKLEISKDKGFTFITSTGSELAPTDLSSGEQHELVLLYELLFKVPAGSLVLIDEPELSLHIAWQQQFLGDLLAITNIAKLDALVATHAPDIIHARWDLTVDLGSK